MFIKLTPINFQHKTTSNVKKQKVTNPNLARAAHDTVSFGAMKKKEFEGIDFAVVEKFKAPVEKFNTNKDLQNWAGEKAKTIADKDFDGRQRETQIQRKTILKEWSNYVFNENDAYKNTTALLILSAITKDLTPDNDNIPPVLNKGILADCIGEINENIKNDPKYQFDLNKMYNNKLRAFYMGEKETNTGETGTKWVVIPSKEHDPENFETNVEKLKALSYKTWCTKTFNAKPYLEEGDFHVYLENGKTKLGVRFIDDEIEEIQGKLNNRKIPIDYFDILQKHISENNLKLTSDAKKEIRAAKKIKKEIIKRKKDLKEAIENNDTKTIYNYFGIDVEENKDGYLTLSKYKQPSDFYTYKSLGIDENKLFEKVKEIKGVANFMNSELTDLGNLEKIGGNAYFSNSRITNLANLKTIGGEADFRISKISDLGNLKTIKGNAYFYASKIINLGNLETIAGSADFNYSAVTNLGNLKTIGEYAYFRNSRITDLGNLEIIGDDTDFRNSKVTNLGNLKTIRGNASFSDSLITNLSNLETIGGSAHFNNSLITDLANLKTIRGNASFSDSLITNLSNLETIGGSAYFNNSRVTNLCKLKTIGGSAYFNSSQISDLANLETVGKDVDIRKSKLKRKDFAHINVGGKILECRTFFSFIKF